MARTGARFSQLSSTKQTLEMHSPRRALTSAPIRTTAPRSFIDELYFIPPMTDRVGEGEPRVAVPGNE